MSFLCICINISNYFYYSANKIYNTSKFLCTESEEDEDHVEGSAQAAQADSFVIPEKVDEDERERISEAVIEAMCSTESKTTGESVTASAENGAVGKCEKASDVSVSGNAEKTNTETTANSATESTPTCEKAASSGDSSLVAPVTPAESTAATAGSGTEKEAQSPAVSDPAKDAESSEADADGEGDGDAACAAVESESAPSEDPDELPTLQLAWEMLECAKLLYTRRIAVLEGSLSSSSTSPEDVKKAQDDIHKFKLRIADCHFRLAEIGLEKGMI